MNMKRLAVGLGIVLIMAPALGSADAHPFHSKQSEDSGSYVSEGTQIDTNGDSRRADLVLTSGKGSHLGEITTQAAVEWPKEFDSAVCNGHSGYKGNLVSGGFVIRTEKGDLLFGTFNSGTNCFDPITNSANISLSGVFTGGTGKFTGVSGGSIAVSSTAIPVIADPLGHQFGSVVSHTQLTLPHE